MKKRVLLVSCEGLGNGGVQSVMMNIVRNLSNEFVFDIILFTSEKRHYDDEFVKYGGKIIRLPNYEGNNRIIRYADIMFRSFWRTRQIRKVIKMNGPYWAIHCNNEVESGLCLKAAKLEHVPIRIAHFHIIYNFRNPLLELINSYYRMLVKRNSTSIIACSKESVISNKISPNDAKIINNPYDNNKFFINSSVEKERAFQIVQIGAYCDNKNQLFSLEVINIIRMNYPSVKFSFVGFEFEEGYLKRMKNYVKINNLENNVKFYHSDADTMKLLDEAALLIQPSKNEGFGVVLIEAQATGTLCYASNSIPKTTNCGGCVYLDLVKGPNYWAKQIVEGYINNKGKHEVYNCDSFSLKHVIKQYKFIYNDRVEK